MDGKLRIGVLFGGKSSEHDVSLASARSVMAAIDPGHYDVVPLGIDRSGRWLGDGDPLAFLSGGEYASPLAASDARTSHAGRVDFGFLAAAVDTQVVARPAAARIFPHVDVIFPVLHGPMGEDGTVQGLLELVGIPYVGSGVTASAVGMDKVQSKAVFAAHGLPQLPYVVVLRRQVETVRDAWLDRLEATLRYPMFVKPANMGSSVGVTKAHDRAELAAGLLEACRFDRKVLVEQGIAAREIEVSVLGNDEPQASLPGEIVPCNEFYDYAAKYLAAASRLLIPAPLPDALTAAVQRLALAAFQALDCAGLARVDFLLDRENDRLYLNEVNTMPGFTQISMYPKLWEASGLGYPDLIERLIDLALARFEDRQRNESTR